MGTFWKKKKKNNGGGALTKTNHWVNCTAHFIYGISLFSIFLSDCKVKNNPINIPCLKLYEYLWIETILEILSYVNNLSTDMLKGVSLRNI